MSKIEKYAGDVSKADLAKLEFGQVSQIVILRSGMSSLSVTVDDHSPATNNYAHTGTEIVDLVRPGMGNTSWFRYTSGISKILKVEIQSR